MKRLSLYLFLLLFALPTPSQADDIRDFQIEGMSIGDSLLDYFSEEKIINKKIFYYKNNKFAGINFYNLSFFEVYDEIQFVYKPNDKKYKIYGIDGVLDFKNNINACFKKKDEIVVKLSGLFKKAARLEDWGTVKHQHDKSGKSLATVTSFNFADGSQVKVVCTDWSEEMGFTDALKVVINSKEFSNFISNEAYK